MLDIIHLILNLLIIVLMIIYIISSCKPYKKNYYDKIKKFRTKFIFSLIICALFFIKAIISFIIHLSFISIISTIICFILWLLVTISNYISIKNILSEDNKIIYLNEEDVKEIE